MISLKKLSPPTWLRKFLHTSPYRVDIPDITVTEYISRQFKRIGNKAALIDSTNNKHTSFNQLEEQINVLSGNLASLGLSPGDVTCLCGLNAPEFAHLFCSVTSLGAAMTVANPQLTHGELLGQVQATGASLMFVTPDCAEKAKTVQQQSQGSVTGIVVIGEHEGCIPLSKLLSPDFSARRKCANTQPQIDPRTDVALIPYSSGTTGLPKGVQLTHRNLVSQLCALSHDQFLPFDDTDRSLSAMPMVHIAGLVIGMLNPLSQGATVVTMPRFKPEPFLEALQKYRTTFSLIAPPVVNFLANDPMVDRYDLRHWRTPYSGAAPLSRTLTEKMVDRLGLTGIRQGYGMSEASPATHTTPLDGWQYGSVGIPLPNTESKVVDVESEETLGPHREGEIWVRGPQVMKGYLNDPRATQEALTPDSWLKTGDIGYYDDNGHYFIVDRLKEIIKYKGYQIAPAYLESVLLSHADVEDAAVVGTPHDVYGHLPTAFVVCNKPTSSSKIAEFVNAQVAPYRRLRGGVHIVRQLPRSPSGKLLRRNISIKFNTTSIVNQ